MVPGHIPEGGFNVKGFSSNCTGLDCFIMRIGLIKRPPLTSFDWNETDRNMIVTSSIDTTCTIWDIEKGVAKTQLIAHDKEVYDVAFTRGKDIFGSVGADGSVRMFDLRSLEHSTIIYEDAKSRPLLRLAWNKQDPNYLATLLLDDNQTLILDVRIPSTPVAKLSGHAACVNAMDVFASGRKLRHECICACV